ncbi:MAG: twin-arginine translocase TatA/TatE family subunit [Acidimicrobiia bacterium]
MGSLGTGELIVIAIVALVVFGPKRLPELARKAGELLAKARTATRSLTDSLDGDYGDLTAPLQTLKTEYDATVKEIKNIGTTVTGMGTTLPGEKVAEEATSPQPTADSEEAEDSSQSTVDGTEEEDRFSQGDAGESDTVDRLPFTDDSSDTVDRDSSS